jgi:hypothetical protein
MGAFPQSILCLIAVVTKDLVTRWKPKSYDMPIKPVTAKSGSTLCSSVIKDVVYCEKGILVFAAAGTYRSVGGDNRLAELAFELPVIPVELFRLSFKHRLHSARPLWKSSLSLGDWQVLQTFTNSG